MTVQLGANFSEYGGQPAAQPGDSVGQETHSPNYWSLERLKRSYTDYLGSKTAEIEEQKDARRYRHGSQWTNQQIRVLNKRHQPIVTYNHIGPKINGVVGIIERLPHNPKGFPRTPKEEEAADIATHSVRYVLDVNRWRTKSAICGEMCGVDGFAGIELLIEPGDNGDQDVAFEIVDNDDFFYDPRSIALDFSDARYMGRGKWLDLDQAKELFPDNADDFEDAMETASDLSTNSDREQKWFISDGYIKRIRVVDEWYRMNGEWCYCTYTGTMKLKEGKSYLIDEKKKTICKYIMFSAAVDQDGDRYGFVRQFKSPQDEINQRRSKGLHLLNTRRIMAEKGAFDDIEKTRVEASRSDGVIEYNMGTKAEFDDEVRLKESEGQIKFLQEAKAELDSYGPTLSMIGDSGVQLSGRAISLQQQAGVAQLGPFILSVRAWKLRVYRSIWNAIRQYWKGERWVRVTDDQNSLQFLGINQVGVNPMTGMPAMVNQVAALDVDIIMDEGADSINAMQDTYDAMVAIVQAGGQVPPDIILELAPGIDPDTRKRLLERLRQPDPAQEQSKQLELQSMAAENEKTQAETAKTKADTMASLMDAGQGQAQQAAPNHEQMAAEQDMILKQQQHQMKLRETELKLRHAEEAHQASLQDQAAKRDMEMQKLALEAHKAKHQEDVSAADHSLKVAQHNAAMVDEKTGTSQLERVSGSMTQGMQGMAETMAQALKQLAENQKALADEQRRLQDQLSSSPVKIARDKKGRAERVVKGEKAYEIKRGKDGRIAALQHGDRTIKIERGKDGRISGTA